MIPARNILLALVIAATPVAATADAWAFPSVQTSAQIDGGRRDKAREEAETGRRLSLSEVVRIVQSGREGRMLGVRPSGDTAVVRWEYPGGRVVDITVDARSGRIIGER
ncbi:MAG: hypothetical protein JWR59_529 [Brevundimonas sp.]|nr:hypothetical protein [Brevundimonas sp.]